MPHKSKLLNGMRWRQKHDAPELKDRFKTNLGLFISVTALLVSLFSAFYSLIDERYDIKMATSFAVPGIAKTDPPLIRSRHTFTFINNGNRPIAINEVALIVQSTKKTYAQLNRTNCEIEYIGPNAFRRAYAELAPFTVKAGEIETRVFDFTAPIEDKDTSRFQDGDGSAHLLSCIQVSFVSAQQAFLELIPYAWSPKASGVAQPFVEVEFFHHSAPVQLVRSRWPFTPDPVATE